MSTDISTGQLANVCLINDYKDGGVLLIENPMACHFETIETVVCKYKQIIGDRPIRDIYIHQNCNFKFDVRRPRQSYYNILAAQQDKAKNDHKKYLSSLYPFIKFEKPAAYDYYINISLYPHEYENVKTNDPTTHFYISHRLSEDIYKSAPNIFYLTPLAMYNVLEQDILPYMNEPKKKTSCPIYVIQGNWDKARRNYTSLLAILKTPFRKDYRIKMLGRGKYPQELEPFKSKIIKCTDYHWEPFHKEFLDCYCILPLISKSSHPQYYSETFTSSISYAKAYTLKALLDKDLQDIYNLPDAEVYTDESTIVKAFEKTLYDFYKR